MPAVEIGSYAWGSLLPRFSPLAPVESRTMPETLSELMTGVGRWQTGAQFRRAISFLHETTHYLQDLTTGAGHWDYLADRNGAATLLLHARELVSPLSELPVERSPALAAAAASASESMIVPPDSAVMEERARFAADRLHAEFGKRLRSLRHDDLVVHNLLEAEAAATVVAHLIPLKLSPEQHEIAQTHAAAWQAEAMQERYSRLLTGVHDTVVELLGDQADRLAEEAPGQVPGFASVLTIVLADLAFAHPTPGHLEELGGDRALYEPGYRFVQYLHATHNALTDERYSNPLLDSVWGEFDLAETERILLEAGGLPYPTNREVYLRWYGLLTQFGNTNDDHIALARALACETRLENPNSCVKKGVGSYFDHGLPLLLASGERLIALSASPDYLPGTEGLELLVRDVAHHGMVRGLAEWFVRSGTFHCPLARDNLCRAHRPRCRSGLQSTSELPVAAECYVRKTLERQGFAVAPAKEVLVT